MKELSTKIKTSVWFEEPADGNPFYPQKSYCHGYDFYGELIAKRSFSELCFLHLRGELPDKRQNLHFNLLLSSIMNPGPRHPANRAGMAAAVSGCPVGSSLSAGFASSMGEYDGGLAVEAVMRMLDALEQQGDDTADRISYDDLYRRFEIKGHIPGFGTLYGVQDIQAIQLVHFLKKKELIGKKLSLFLSLEKPVSVNTKEWIRLYGVFAASLSDLGFTPEQGHGLYMLSSGFGMLSFICERYSEKWHEYPTWFGHGIYRYQPEKNKNGSPRIDEEIR